MRNLKDDDMVSAAALMSSSETELNCGGHERLIDLVYLARQTMGNKSLEAEILRLFKTQLEIHQSHLQMSENGDDLHMRLHTLKGAARGVGASEVGHLAATAEISLLEGADGLDDEIKSLLSSIQATSTYIDQLLAD